jgi:hypothetical protein
MTDQGADAARETENLARSLPTAAPADRFAIFVSALGASARIEDDHTRYLERGALFDRIALFDETDRVRAVAEGMTAIADEEPATRYALLERLAKYASGDVRRELVRLALLPGPKRLNQERVVFIGALVSGADEGSRRALVEQVVAGLHDVSLRYLAPLLRRVLPHAAQDQREALVDRAIGVIRGSAPDRWTAFTLLGISSHLTGEAKIAALREAFETAHLVTGSIDQWNFARLASREMEVLPEDQRSLVYETTRAAAQSLTRESARTRALAVLSEVKSFAPMAAEPRNKQVATAEPSDDRAWGVAPSGEELLQRLEALEAERVRARDALAARRAHLRDLRQR